MTANFIGTDDEGLIVEEGNSNQSEQGSRPSEAAVSRLRDRVRERTQQQRERTTVDLALVEALISVGATEDASRMLDEYAQVLSAYVRDLEADIASSAAEHEAERIVAASALHLQAPASPPATVASAVPEPDPTVRRRLVGSLAAFAAAFGLSFSPMSMAPPGSQVVEADLATAELAAASARLTTLIAERTAQIEVHRESRRANERIRDLPASTLGSEDVRAEIVILLALQERAIEDAEPQPPTRELRDEIAELREVLDLPTPAAPPTPLAIPPVEVEDTVDGLPSPPTQVEEQPGKAGQPSSPAEQREQEDASGSGSTDAQEPDSGDAPVSGDAQTQDEAATSQSHEAGEGADGEQPSPSGGSWKDGLEGSSEGATLERDGLEVQG